MSHLVYAQTSGSTAGSVQPPAFVLSQEKNGQDLARSAMTALLERLEADAWVSHMHAGIYQHLIADMLTQSDSTVTATFAPADLPLHVSQQTVRSDQDAKNQAAKTLIMQWLADESGYDESVWPILQQTIEENRPSRRKRFHG